MSRRTVTGTSPAAICRAERPASFDELESQLREASEASPGSSEPVEALSACRLGDRVPDPELAGMQTRLVQAEGMALLGRLVAGLSHELDNSTGVISANASLGERLASRASSAAAPRSASASR